MYERFTDRTRKVMKLAAQSANSLGHKGLGTEHILLGLLEEGAGVGAYVLKSLLDRDLDDVRAEVEKHTPCGPESSPEQETEEEMLPHTAQAMSVIEHARQEAVALNHNYVGTEHLLLGLCHEPESLAGKLLTGPLGLKLDDVRQEVLNILGHGCE